MIQPTPRAVLTFAIGIAVAILPAAVDERLWTAWLAFVFLAALAFGLDAVALLPARGIELSIEAPARIHIGSQAHLSIALWAPRARGDTSIEALLDLDESLEPQPARILALPAGGRARCRVPLRPARRGTARARALWLRWSGPLGLCRRSSRRELDREIPVVPDVGAVRATALRFFGSPSHLSGLKTERYLGDGSEFESLRRYVPGFDSRSIDWKASARHRRLLVRSFRAERNHQVVIAIDSGHLMGEPLRGIPRLDHAINGGLILAYCCLRTGDRVGLLGFDSRPRTFLEPRGGLRAFARIQQASAGIEYGVEETNFTLGLLELDRRLRRRSLVIVFTDFVDTITAELMVENLHRLSRRHLVIFVAPSDPDLEQLERLPPRNLKGLNRAVVASQLNRERELVFRRLRQRGISVLDAPPEQVSTRLLNRYLEIKRRELV